MKMDRRCWRRWRWRARSARRWPGQANSGYQTEQQRKAVASGLADPARDEKQKPGELVRAMGLQPGMTVADVGTGIGYMLPFLSRRVGPTGQVIAEDIFDDFLDSAKQRAENQKLENVTFVKGTETDPKLPEGAWTWCWRWMCITTSTIRTRCWRRSTNRSSRMGNW